jgi:pimeloyl-ACP methyl ester carboxylesterase
MRWLARNAPAPEPLLRTGVGRTLCAGPAIARPWRLDPDDLVEVLRLFAHAPGFLATLPHTFSGQVRGLNEIEVPVLLLWGTRDLILLPRQARRFERLIPNCELHYLKGLGHTPMSDDPLLLADALADFAARTRRRAPRAEAPA